MFVVRRRRGRCRPRGVGMSAVRKKELQNELGESWQQDLGYRDYLRNRETRTAIIRYLEEVMRMREESLRVRGYKMSSLVQDEDTEDEEERQVRIRWTCQGDRG
ncbi:hypothetical protein RUM44_007842 [Polyplax serrata]|uniref:Uncharacterized protein n=1 Tax=Polyplax serrata TaxID=468196 RepID=A0ABR1B8N7_POLSC